MEKGSPYNRLSDQVSNEISSKNKYKDKEEKEEQEENDFPPTSTKLKEGERPIDETITPEWMDAGTKTKEVDIQNDGGWKLEKVGDYWSEQHTTKIINLLKEYHDIFARDYKDLKGLIEEMGET